MDLSGAALTGALTTIDASANTGGVNLKVASTTIPAEGATITGGSGNDELAFTAAPTAKVTTDLGAGDDTLVMTGALGALVTGSTFNGGDGTDTLIFDGVTGVNAKVGSMFSGFETLVLQGTSSYEMGSIAGISNYVVDDSGATTATFTNVSSGTSILVAAHDATQDTVSATLANGATPPALSLVLDNQSDTAATGADVKVETNAYTLNLTSGGNLDELALNKVTLSGDSLSNVAKISVTGDSDFSLTAGIATKLDYIDASAMAADVTVDASAATTVGGMTIITGSGNDVIKAATTGGTITGGAGADKMTAGAGDDIFVQGKTDSGITLATADSIDQFVTTKDAIKTGTAGSADNYNENASTVADFAAALEAANAAMDGTVIYSFQSDGTDGYLFWDTDGDGNADQAITLLGLTSDAGFAFGDIIA